MSRKSVCLGAVAIIGFALGLTALAAEVATPSLPVKAKEVLDHFNAGLDYYEMAEYDNADAEFAAMMNLEPDNEVALIMRERIGIDKLVRLMKDKRFHDTAYQILMMAQEKAEALRTDPKRVQELVDNLKSTDRMKRWSAIRQLSACGDYAVPYLIKWASSPEPSVIKTVRVPAHIAVRNMGQNAILPLIEALNSDELSVKSEVFRLMKESGDIRAAPALQAAVQDDSLSEDIRTEAKEALDAIARRAFIDEPFPPADQLYYKVAERYYSADPKLVDYVPGLRRTIWDWKETDSESYADKIVPKVVPQYIYNELMAEKLIYRGLALTETPDAFLGLLVANNYQQWLESRAIAEGYPPYATLAGREVSEEDRKEASERAKKLEKVRLINRILGERSLYLALGRALKDQDPILALSILQSLRETATGSKLDVAYALGEALTDNVKEVRYAATEVMLHIAPHGQLGYTDELAQMAANALSERSRPTALVISPNIQTHNSYARMLKELNWIPDYASEAMAGLHRAKSPAPPLSLVVVDDAIKEMSAAQVIANLRKDARSKHLPLALLSEAAPPEEVQQAIVSALPKTPDKDTLQKLLKKVEAMPSVSFGEAADAQAAMLKIVRAISEIDPAVTVYDLKSLAPLLVKLLAGQPTEVQMAALKALDKLGDASMYEAVAKMFADSKLSKELRLRAGATALFWGRLDLSEEQLTTLKTLGKGADPDISRAAATIIGQTQKSSALEKALANEYRANP